MFASTKFKFLVAPVWATLVWHLWFGLCEPQQTHVVLDQGAIVGFKVFPDTTRTAVYAFLGLPYAQPPVGRLRFAPPEPHSGWNSTLQAINIKPICPQLINTVYDETADGSLARPAAMDENCLFLNIWVPEVGMGYSSLPVLAIISGEDMSYDWPRNRVTGLDFALEGVIVVTVQYRQNIFGWIGLGNSELPGNYGLQDQRLALQWIQHNIAKFGGNPGEVTLLGHGTSGAPCAMALALMRHSGEQLFSKLLLMSGGDLEVALSSSAVVQEASSELIRKLGCQFEKHGNLVTSCLRAKSVSDLQKAFESIHDHGNGTLSLGPMLPTEVQELFARNTHSDQKLSLMPTLIGITSNEGAFSQDYWLNLARQGYKATWAYVNFTALPSVITLCRRVPSNAAHIRNAINWQYFSEEASASVSHLLNAMQRLISEACYETPFFGTLEFLTSQNINNSVPLYAYVFEMPNSMDMRGKVNFFGGASHSSDLPLLLGPSLFQQISRRRFTVKEEKICRKMRNEFANFVKGGNPTPGRTYDAWLPYTKEHKFIFNIAEQLPRANEIYLQFQKNLPLIETQLKNDTASRVEVELSQSLRNDYSNDYRLTRGQLAMDARRSQSISYSVNPFDSGYATHLKQVYSFWQVLLPNIATCGNSDAINDPLSQRIRFMEASADAARYKQGFFVMLSLVAVLLIILGLCVYLLRRDSLRTTVHGAGFCL